MSFINMVEKNKRQFNRELKAISNWNQWESFKEKWFSLKQFKKKKIKDITKELETRKPIQLNGLIWFPIVSEFDYPPEFNYLRRQTEDKVLEKIDPEGHKWLYTLKQGRECTFCNIYVKNNLETVCPICKRNLLYLYIDDEPDAEGRIGIC
jgi:ferredoxin